MKIVIAAIGRLKAGPESELFERYFDLAGKAGRRLGLTFDFREFAESRAGDTATRKHLEAGALAAAAPTGAGLAALDERGKLLDSRAFASDLARRRDDGTEALTFVIGGADGLDPALVARANLHLSLGAMTWPHQLVRIMLAEQLYRAVTILSGHPYHRD